MASDSQPDVASPASRIWVSPHQGRKPSLVILTPVSPPHISDRAKVGVVPGGHAEGHVRLQPLGLRCWLSLLLSVFGLSHKEGQGSFRPVISSLWMSSMLEDNRASAKPSL